MAANLKDVARLAGVSIRPCPTSSMITLRQRRHQAAGTPGTGHAPDGRLSGHTRMHTAVVRLAGYQAALTETGRHLDKDLIARAGPLRRAEGVAAMARESTIGNHRQSAAPLTSGPPG
jgi:DNA-binding LacI/PurR family transcriptional regulator